MAAITISAPIVAKAPVAMRRTRVTARAAVAPAASTSAVSFGARKMMTGASVQAARVQQTAAGRKSLVWCVLRPDTPPESTPVERARVPSSRARASLDRTSGWASPRGPRPIDRTGFWFTGKSTNATRASPRASLGSTRVSKQSAGD
jgi:hypothetical protein